MPEPVALHPLVADGLRTQLDAGWVERHQLGVDASRAQLAARPVEASSPIPCDVADENIVETADVSSGATASAVPVRRYRPSDGRAVGATFVFLHGGGWVLGDLDLSDRFCRELASRAACEVVSVGYRLAPEHPFPAALDDTISVLTHLRSVGNSPIIIGGISAGGNLAAATCIRLRDEQAPLPDLQVLVCPVLDITCSSASYRELATGYYLTASDMRWFWEQYTGESSPRDDDRGWRSPLQAPDLAGLPPALVINAQYDVLRDEGQDYAARLASSGIDACSVTFGGMIHGFISDVRLAPARAAMSLLVHTVNDLVHGAHQLCGRPVTEPPPDPSIVPHLEEERP